MPERNIELLTKIRDLVKLAPQKLDMDYWSTIPYDMVQLDDGSQAKVSCGTTQCIAGWAVQLSGYQFLVGPDNLVSSDDVYYPESCVAEDGVADIYEKAVDLLGLTACEADLLFLAINNSEAIDALDLFIAGKSLDEIRDELFSSEDEDV